METEARGLLPWHFTRPFPPALRAKMRGASQEAGSAAGVTCEEEMTFWGQAFGSLGFKNMKGLLHKVHRHMSHTMWKRCHKIINEARSLATGDMYFGG